MNRKSFRKKNIAICLVLIFGTVLTGCKDSQSTAGATSTPNVSVAAPAPSGEADSSAEGTDNVQEEISGSLSASPADLEVRFGDDGAPFAMHMYENDTAAAIGSYVGTADWRLPINHFDDYENWEVMQYYDLPSRYEIPSNPETITSAKAGEVYYSDPSRIVLFYGDAEIAGEYTKVGYFNNTDEFRAAVTNNPVLEGWSNKIVNISDGE